MRNATNRRQGMALMLALVLIVIISSIIAGAFVAATQEYRVGRNGLIQERALTAAEFGQNQVLAQWNKGVMPGKNAGDTLRYVDAVGNGATAVTTVTKLNTATYWVVSEGQATMGNNVARRRVNSILRLNIPSLKMPGTLTTNSPTALEGNGSLDNKDENPVGWDGDCPPPGAPNAGVANDEGTISNGGGCAGYACIASDPKTVTDAAAADTMFGGLPYDSLAARASRTFILGGATNYSIMKPAYNADGSCNTANTLNWGDANRNLVLAGACETYFPTIRFKGNYPVTVSNGQGQGVLLVDGDLNVNGQFIWTGAIIVRGTVKVTGLGNKLVGGVISLDQNCKIGGSVKYCNYLAGTAEVQFSRCAIMTAFAAQAFPVLAKHRAWADMY